MYGLMILLGTIAGLFLAENLAKKRGLDLKVFWECAFWVILTGIIGARAWHVVEFWEVYSVYPPAAFFIWNGGMHIFGTLTAGILTASIFLRAKKQNVLEWLDIFSVVLPLGQSIGRLGNIFNNELLPFAIYELIADLTLFVILFFVYRRQVKPGTIFALYLIAYILIRIALQPFRL